MMFRGCWFLFFSFDVMDVRFFDVKRDPLIIPFIDLHVFILLYDKIIRKRRKSNKKN